MIAKMVKGRGFRGALEYDLAEGKGRVIDTNMAGNNPRELAAEFGQIRKIRPTLGKAVLHVSLSAAPGEKLTDEQWRDIGQRYLRGMGYRDNQYIITRHTDTEHEHIHILANRITHAGEVVSDGQDYKRQETIMREIERDYGLRQVASSAEVKRKAPTKGEIEHAMRTGQPSTRDQLQKLCDGAAKDCRSITEYVERLEAVGVEVVPTVQQGGAKLSGIQYRLDGVTMKGSDLGKSYAAAGIQKRGISYDQNRDFAAVERCREREAARALGEPDRELEAGQALEHGGTGHGAEHHPVRAVEQPIGAANEPPQRGEGRAELGATIEQGNREGGQHQHQPEIVAEGTSPSDGGSRGGTSGNGDWASRFKRDSARRRREAESRDYGHALATGHSARARVDASDRRQAREIDPTQYLESHGYTVKREGRHLSVRQGEDEVYRMTRQQDGHWVWCDIYGNSGGDNIDLVREIEPGTGYTDAVHRLIGAPLTTQPVAPRREPPRLPAQVMAAITHGRDYLRGRGISPDTINRAEQAGMVYYSAGAVLFVGYDHQGTVQNATRRATVPTDPVQKRDLRGSSKTYPPILPGHPAEVWIVEGGMDALALHDLYRRARKQPPTAIVSGGAGVFTWLNNRVVQEILKLARRVVVAFENEDRPEVQEKTDAGHQRQMARIAEIVGREPEPWYPPSECKDIADLNVEAQIADTSVGYDYRQDTIRMAADDITRDSPHQLDEAVKNGYDLNQPRHTGTGIKL